MKTHISERLAKIRNLPTIPVVIQNLRRAISDPRADAAKISSIIENDPAMMSRILKIVNSVFYGGVEPIVSVRHAVARMGFSAINNIALSTFVFTSFSISSNRIFDPIEFWRHCIVTGIAAEHISMTTRNKTGSRFGRDLLHLTGLLHDIGKIVFVQNFHDNFMKAVTLSKTTGTALLPNELKILETDHCETGAWLAEKWKLTPEIIAVIRWHHEPERAPQEYYNLVCLCHAADFLCNSGNFGGSGNSSSPQFSPVAFEHLGLGETDIPNLITQIQIESGKSETLLSLFR